MIPTCFFPSLCGQTVRYRGQTGWVIGKLQALGFLTELIHLRARSLHNFGQVYLSAMTGKKPVLKICFLLVCWFCPTNRYSIYKEMKQKILTFEKLQPDCVLHFWLINDLK